MARNQKNFQLFTYVDDNGTSWNVRGEDGGAASAVDGHATFTATAPVWDRNTTRQHVRYVVYEDPTTHRTIKPIIYTPTAYAAIALGSTLAVSVAGLTTTVSYNATKKIPEKQASRKSARQLPDA